MGVHIDHKKLVITETKTFHFHFDKSKDVDHNLRHEINHIIKHSGFIVKQIIKAGLDGYCANISMITIFMNKENS